MNEIANPNPDAFTKLRIDRRSADRRRIIEIQGVSVLAVQVLWPLEGKKAEVSLSWQIGITFTPENCVHIF
jgi:hypothetical protein